MRIRITGVLRVPALLAGAFAALLPVAGCFDLLSLTLPEPKPGPERSPIPQPEQLPPPRFAWPFEVTATFKAPEVAYAPLVLAVERATGRSVPLDLNGDGWPDVVLVDSILPQVHTFFGDGAGALRSPVVTDLTLTVGGGGIDSAPVAGDFDGDGDVDLVFMRYWWLGVLPNNGDGTFAAPFFVEFGDLAGRTGIEAVTADFDDDGDLDLALATGKPADVCVLENGGLANFLLRPERYAATDQTEFLTALTAADVNDDGRVDLAVTLLGGLSGADEVRILGGNGDGSFVFTGAFSVGWGPCGVVAGDFGSPQRPQLGLAVMNATIFAPSTSLLYGNGDGGFLANEQVTTTGGSGTIAAGDVDADGDMDLLLAQTQFHRRADRRGLVNGLNVLFNHEGRFDGRDVLSLPLNGDATNGSVAAAALVDLNLDGAADAVVFDSGYAVAELVVMKAIR